MSDEIIRRRSNSFAASGIARPDRITEPRACTVTIRDYRNNSNDGQHLHLGLIRVRMDSAYLVAPASRRQLFVVVLG